MDIKVFDSIAPAGVDDGLVGHVRDGEVVDGVVQRGLRALRQAAGDTSIIMIIGS